ncbi:MAG TPA: sugar phosphate isomerase/epimerase [Anaerolineae bacterium]|nr:sugar phosphate isomerase/epimerase [Anaerolineae bacterium]HQJ51737.1 sugar phosphate isomerase/epimerase [Anaerolineae bacterium]
MLALSTGTLHNYGLDRVFALAREAGFQGIEVIVDARWDTRQRGYLDSLRQRHGLPIVSLHAPFLPGIQGWNNDPVANLKNTVQLAADLQVGIVVCHVPMRWHWLSIDSSLLRRRVRAPILWPRWHSERARSLAAVRELARPNVAVLLENMPASLFLGIRYGLYAPNRLQELAKLGDLVLDTTHVGTWGWDLMEVYEQLKPRVRHVHLSDYNGHEHIPPGKGSLPLAAFLRALAIDGYGGSIVVESGPEHFSPNDEKQLVAGLKACVDYCQTHFRKEVVV